MTDGRHQQLRQMAEGFRARGGSIEGKYGKKLWVQSLNVMEAFEQCAEELETFLKESEASLPDLEKQ